MRLGVVVMALLTVILILARLSGVFGPSIKCRSTERSVKMNRKVLITMVLEPYNGFSALGHPECRSW